MNPTELVRAVAAQFPNFERLLSGFTQSRRLLQVTFASSMGLPGDAVLSHQLTVSEGICEPLSPIERYIDAAEGIHRCACCIPSGRHRGAERTICAIVFEARQLAADGGFVLYEFVCTDALSLLDQRVAELELALNEPYIEPELPSDGQKPQEVWQVAQTLERVVKDKKSMFGRSGTRRT